MRKTAFALMLLILLCGCGFKDVDKRHFAVAIGFDKSKHLEGGYNILLKIAIPQGDPKGGTQQFEVIQEESKSIAEALRRLKSKVDKELDFSHTKAILIGEGLAKEEISPFIDWASRRRDIQLVGLVAVAMPTAEAVMQVKPKGERIPANALFLALGEEGTESPYIIGTYLFDLERRLSEEGLDPIIPIVEARKGDLTIEKAVLLDKTKIVLALTPQETRLYKLLTKNNLKTDFAITQRQGVISMNVERSRAAYRIVNEPEGKSYLHYQLNLEGDLEEEHNGINKLDRETIQRYTQAFEAELNQQVKALLQKMQQHHLDPVGFGLRYAAHTWSVKNKAEAWKQLYPELDMKVTSKVKLKETGEVL
ncbi:Ger(x)C family spore germination protein [Paenibacillus filicis]|uniref:Ger(X)C family spore germination protein n=1 Tax=Paenibacillus filicis TaxID=669464 RepID=A0ABU9DSH5_9BACL